MSYSLGHFTQSWRGDLGVGKRPDELPRPDRSTELLGTTEAARRLGITPRSVLMLIRTNKLPERQIGDRFYVTRGDVERRISGDLWGEQ